jgi:hypothetical protein
MLDQRYTIMRPREDNESEYIQRLADFWGRRGLQIAIDKNLLFWPHHFEAFEHGYPNGHIKGGTIRFKQGCIRVPFGKRLPVYESTEFKQNLPPRGIVTIDYVSAAPLCLVIEQEWLRDGFESKEDLLWQMAEYPGRYYKELTRYSPVSFYNFESYDPAPSQEEFKELLELLDL